MMLELGNEMFPSDEFVGSEHYLFQHLCLFLAQCRPLPPFFCYAGSKLTRIHKQAKEAVTAKQEPGSGVPRQYSDEPQGTTDSVSNFWNTIEALVACFLRVTVNPNTL